MTRLIDTDILKEAIKTYDEFACLSNGILEPFRNLEHPEMFEPYIHLRDVIKAIDNAPTIPLPDFKEGYKQAILDGKTNYSRPQGMWIRDIQGDTICSNCGFECCYDIEGLYSLGHYCQHCGADMKKLK